MGITVFDLPLNLRDGDPVAWLLIVGILVGGGLLEWWFRKLKRKRGGKHGYRKAKNRDR